VEASSGADQPLLSVVIPAHDEQDSIADTLRALYACLAAEGIEHELLVINDNSKDGTESVLRGLQQSIPSLRYVDNEPPHGFGFAVRRGLDLYRGDAVAIVMADASDAPEDVARFYHTLVATGADCVFGSRWMRGGRTEDYPLLKRAINRLVNNAIRLLFGFRYDDVTNAFKLYRRYVIDGVRPILSHHFNLTVELPLKAIVRGYSYEVLPNQWRSRRGGQSKLLLKEMGSRYLFIVLYCFIENWLSAGDYHRRAVEEESADPAPASDPASGRGA
jgi:dolichol-phosphate mannosyltransferase